MAFLNRLVKGNFESIQTKIVLLAGLCLSAALAIVVVFAAVSA